MRTIQSHMKFECLVHKIYFKGIFVVLMIHLMLNVGLIKLIKTFNLSNLLLTTLKIQDEPGEGTHSERERCLKSEIKKREVKKIMNLHFLYLRWACCLLQPLINEHCQNSGLINYDPPPPPLLLLSRKGLCFLASFDRNRTVLHGIPWLKILIIFSYQFHS